MRVVRKIPSVSFLSYFCYEYSSVCFRQKISEVRLANDFQNTSAANVFSHTNRETKQKKEEDLVYIEGQAEVQNNLGVVQLLKRFSPLSFSMNDKEQGIIGGCLRKDEEGLTETIIIQADSDDQYSLC